MDQTKIPPVTNLSVDLAEILGHLVAETGAVQQSMGGFRIKVYHTRGFPWDDVFKALLYRDFRVYVTRQNADLFIEASI